MKKHLVVALFVVIAGAVTAGAQTQSYSAAVTEKKQTSRQQALNPAPTRAVGAFPRVSRNPAQLINPLAPRRYYAPPEETVTTTPNFAREPYTGSYVTGLILFGLRW